MWVCRFGTPLLAHQPSHSRHSHARSRPLAQLRQGALLHWGLAKEPFKNTSKPQQMLEASWNDMQTLTTLERASRANGIPPEPTISKKWTKMKKELKRYRLRQLRISRKDARRDFFETSRCEALNLRFINASIISHDYTIVRVYVLVSLNWQKFWGTVFQQMHYKNANCTHHTGGDSDPGDHQLPPTPHLGCRCLQSKKRSHFDPPATAAIPEIQERTRRKHEEQKAKAGPTKMKTHTSY